MDDKAKLEKIAFLINCYYKSRIDLSAEDLIYKLNCIVNGEEENAQAMDNQLV